MVDLICIACPRGCRLHVETVDNQLIVTGNKCPKGIDYGIKEVTSPTRIITSTVKVIDSVVKRLPVVTETEVPKGLMFDVMAEINTCVVRPPVYIGDVVIKDIAKTGVDLISSKTVLD